MMIRKRLTIGYMCDNPSMTAPLQLLKSLLIESSSTGVDTIVKKVLIQLIKKGKSFMMPDFDQGFESQFGA